MKPVLLKISGLNSFLEEQIIDFNKLTTYGFFGIFGTTGSGKSTIIDAITLALYGEISRYDGKKSMQFINTNTDSMSVFFEFQIKTEDGYINYEIERSFKRNKNKIEPLVVRFTMKKGTETTILENKTKKADEQIKRVLGLSYKDFSRTVVLPQGKFSDFLMLANADRRNMLERIFKLEKYGDYLTSKIKDKYKEELNACEIVDNSLSIYGDVTKTEIEKNLSKIKDEQNNFIKLKETFEKTNSVLVDLKNTQNIYNEYKSYNTQKNNLISFENDIKEKMILLNNSKKASIVLPYIENLESTNEKLSEKEIDLKNKELKNADIIIIEKEITIEYDQIKVFKDENLPILQEKSSKTKDAILVQKELEEIKVEREKLVKEYTTIKNDFNKYTELKTKQLETKKELNDQLKEITIRKQEINIKPTFRNNITIGSELYVKKNTLTEKISLLNKKHSSLLEKINKSSLSLDENKKQSEKIEKDLVLYNEKLKDLILNTPDQKKLLTIKESFINKENELKNNVQLNELIKNINLKTETILKQVEKNKKIYSELSKEIILQEEKFTHLENELEKIKKDNLIYMITKDLKEGQACPVCGSLEYKINVKDINTDTHVENKENLKKIINKLKEKFQDLKIEIELNTRDFETAEKQKKEYESKIVSDIATLEKDLEDLKIQFATLSKQIEEFNNKKETLDSNISSYISLSNDYKVKIATFLEINTSNKTSIKELEEELRLNQNELFETNNELDKLVIEININPTDKTYFSVWKNKIIDYDKENQQIEKKENRIRIEIETMEIHINKYTDKIVECEKEQERITTIGNEKKNFINKYLEKIKTLVGDNEPSEYLKILDKEIEDIIKKEKSIKEKLDSTLKEKEEIQQSIQVIKNQIDTLQEIKIEQNNLLQSRVLESGIQLEQILKCIIGTSKENELEQSINKYNEDLNKVNNNIETLKQKLSTKNTNNIDTEILKQTEITKLIDETIGIKTKEIAILEENTIKMQKDFSKIKELKKQKQEHIHQIDLLSDLESLFKANKFVEFVAKKQLKYITIEASNRLKEMTKGRYSLELDETDFVIRDDFNGGIRRTPRSLSGGETFMTSLCLALALSSKVQLNNKNPLEFFFLDEGFGTLDLNALDDVINTLEKLRMENINIGIISHSEELKNRVPIKLIVSKSENGFGGSRVFIE